MTVPYAYDKRGGIPARAGTRMLRARTANRIGAPGQPDPPRTDPRHVRPADGTRAPTCAECFKPRSRYGSRFFCLRCERLLFGPAARAGDALEAFIRSERAKNVGAARRARRLAEG